MADSEENLDLSTIQAESAESLDDALDKKKSGVILTVTMDDGQQLNHKLTQEQGAKVLEYFANLFNPNKPQQQQPTTKTPQEILAWLRGGDNK